MALSKIIELADRPIVEEIILPEDTKVIPMGIKENAYQQILARLTDQYKDPIVATVREVVQNAIDATVIMPKDKQFPVEIISPSILESSFKVVDHGIGMSVDTITNIISQYGGTTKEKDFRTVGAYGLGAKAPLAYCSEFNVETTHNGVTSTFIVSRNGEGNFTKIIDSKETGKESGTTVTIPVSMDDRDAFLNALKNYKEYSFDVQIIVDGIKFGGDNQEFFLFDNIILDSDSKVEGRVWIRKTSLSNICNDLDKTSIYGYSNSNFNNKYNIHYSLSGWIYGSPNNYDNYYDKNLHILVELKPGVVDFSSSRDEITKNPRSKNLHNNIIEIFKEKTYFHKNFLKYLKTMDEKDILPLILNLKNNFKKKDTKLYFMGIETDSKLFTNNDGFNIINFLSKKESKNIYAKTKLLSPGYYAQDYSELDIPNFVFKSNHWANENRQDKVSDINKYIYDQIEKDKLEISLKDVILYDLSQNWNTTHYNNSYYSKNKYAVITGLTKENIRKFLKERSILAENDFKGYSFVFSKESKNLTKQIDFWKEQYSEQIEINEYSVDELIKIAKDLRKSNTNNYNKVDVSKEVSFYKISDDFKSISDKLNSLEDNIVKENISLKDVMAKKALIIVFNGKGYNNVHYNIKPTLIGAVNKKLIDENTPIYAVNQESIYASHYNILLDYEKTAVDQDFKYNSISAKKLMETKVFHDNILLEKVISKSTEILLLSYIYDNMIFNYNGCFKYFKEYINNNNSDLYNIFKDIKVSDVSNINRERIDPEILKKILIERIGEESLELVDSFNKTIKYFYNVNHYGRTFEELMVVNMLQTNYVRSSVSNTKLINNVFEVIFEKMKEF